MRYILLSFDGKPELYEAPDAIAEALDHYCRIFLENINRLDSCFWRRVEDASGQSYDCLEYSKDDFIAWLNSLQECRHQPVRPAVRLTMEDREIIMETARKERYYPFQQQQYPWFSF